MPEVSYNQSLTNQNFYGFGVIQATPFNNLDSQMDLKMEKGGNPCIKEEIRYEPTRKVRKSEDNYIKEYINESINNLNYDKRQAINLEQGLTHIEYQENQNLDFDNDGDLDVDLARTNMPKNEKAEHYIERMEQTIDMNQGAEPHHSIDQQIQESSIKKDEKEHTIIEPTLKDPVDPERKVKFAGEQELPKKYEKPQNQLLEPTAQPSDKKIRMADGVVMGAGALALAMMIMGRATN